MGVTVFKQPPLITVLGVNIIRLISISLDVGEEVEFASFAY